MMSLTVTFWMYVFTFAIIGAMRGWVKELLVVFSVILCLFLINVLDSFTPVFRVLAGAPATLFWVKTILLLILTFFGYQTPNIPKIANTGKLARERLQDILLGFVLGAINGFFVFGTIWYFLDKANYPFPFIYPPMDGDPLAQSAYDMLPFLPPAWLGSPYIYFAVGLAFVFVLVVFI
ncbi:MAG: hypothetical protein LDL12_03135 [Anaerolinea sp.]|nr:hypothetical protein [Anaerolinea sp.]